MANDPAQDALPAGMSASSFSSLFQAVNGLRNRRALVALIGSTVLGVLVAGLLVAMGGGFLASAPRASSSTSWRSAPASTRPACCTWTTPAASRRAARSTRWSTG